MNILVTGGAGFIGTNVILDFIARPEVRQIVNADALTYAGHLENLTAVCDHPKYQFRHLDLRDESAVRQLFREFEFTHVLHLAAESHVDRSIAGPKDSLINYCRVYSGTAR